MEIHRRGPTGPTGPTAGAPIVLIHGIGSRWQVFEPILDLLATDHAVIAIDLPGFGNSPAEAGTTPTVDGYATRVTELIMGLGIDKPHVIGNSMGGGIALELGRRGVASRVTAFSPVGFWTPGERRWGQSILTVMRSISTVARPLVRLASRSRIGRTALFSLFYGKPWLITPADAALAVDGLVGATAFTQARKGFDEYDLRARPRPADGLARIPVTIAWGSRDAILPARRQSAVARKLLPDARHLTLPSCGHLPFSDNPALCVDAVRGGS